MPLYERVRDALRPAARTSACATAPRRSASACVDLRARRCCSCRSSARSSCRTSTKARCGFARRCRTRSRSRRRRSSGRRCASILLGFPQVTTVANELGRARRRHRSDRVLQRRVLRRAQAVRRSGVAAASIRTKAAADRRDPGEARRVSRASSSTTRSRPRTRSTRRRPG